MGSDLCLFLMLTYDIHLYICPSALLSYYANWASYDKILCPYEMISSSSQVLDWYGVLFSKSGAYLHVHIKAYADNLASQV